MISPLPFQGRTAIVTGVSRRQGIGFAIASRLAEQGADLCLAHHRQHDDGQPWGADDIASVVGRVADRRADATQRLVDIGIDLAEAGSPERVVQHAVDAFGHVDVLVCNHARSGDDGPLGELTVEMLDAHWSVNARASLLLAQAFLAQHDGRPGGRVIFMTSGQGLGPMPGEVAYASSKAALAGVTLTLADQLADRGITVNTVNPGPVDTGYLDAEGLAAIRPMLPFGRMGEPDDAARLICWLASDEGRWVTGQVINSEGGFARWRAPG